MYIWHLLFRTMAGNCGKSSWSERINQCAIDLLQNFVERFSSHTTFKVEYELKKHLVLKMTYVRVKCKKFSKNECIAKMKFEFEISGEKHLKELNSIMENLIDIYIKEEITSDSDS